MHTESHLPTFHIVLRGVACVSLASLTLLLPSVPSYDPWSWLVWGREVVHLDLNTMTGPSWKPLPVLLTAPYSLAGSAAPDLWLATARAATFGAVLVAVTLGMRFAGRLAGVFAGAALLLSPWLWHAVWTGNSEGILILCVLAATERQLAGRSGQAFALAVVAGLLRPEAWVFLGLYAAWLVAQDRRRLRWAVGGLALIPALWFLPELWGSGSLFRAAERAREAGLDAPANTAHPALTVLQNFGRLAPWHVRLGVVAWIVWLLLGRRHTKAEISAMALGGLGLAWLLIVAAMSEIGFSGIDRYIFICVAIACVLAGVGLAWTLIALCRPGDMRVARSAGAVLIAALSLAGVGKLSRDFRLVKQLDHEAAVLDDLDVAIRSAGGPHALEACGPLYASHQTTPSIAWTLGRHLEEVSPFAMPPGTVLRAQLILEDPIDPPAGALAESPDRKEVARTEYWHVESACKSPDQPR